MAKKQDERLICDVCQGLIYDGVETTLINGGLYGGRFCHADLRDCIRHLAIMVEPDPVE